ncbi:MAG: D-alanyl-D-alanine carboxypeptidase, partial [Betaproteobacteria bacterium]|nr:D-alanyl-D-alanine carboxypeptidase [Betaproteobacteria bacterium]
MKPPLFPHFRSILLRCGNMAAWATLAVAGTASAALPPAIEQQLAAAGMPADAMAVLVQRVSDGKIVVSHQPDRPMAPASTLKLVTTLVGIERLGPVYRGKTELLSAAKPQGEVLAGDLILRGGGDGDLDW